MEKSVYQGGKGTEGLLNNSLKDKRIYPLASIPPVVESCREGH